MRKEDLDNQSLAIRGRIVKISTGITSAVFGAWNLCYVRFTLATSDGVESNYIFRGKLPDLYKVGSEVLIWPDDPPAHHVYPRGTRDVARIQLA